MRYILSLGSNTADGEQRLEQSIASLAERWPLAARSAVYSTEALNGKSPDYHNAVVAIESYYSVEELNAFLKQMEVEAGRTEECRRQGIVPLDIDIVMADLELIRPDDAARDYFTIGYQQIT